MIKLTQPQELEAFYILPALRRELALSMAKNGIGQKEIAKKMCVTEAAVSQYIRGKRGKDILFDKSTIKQINDCTNKLETPEQLTEQIQFLLAHARKKKVICEVCRKYNSRISKKCKVCFK